MIEDALSIDVDCSRTRVQPLPVSRCNAERKTCCWRDDGSKPLGSQITSRTARVNGRGDVSPAGRNLLHRAFHDSAHQPHEQGSGSAAQRAEPIEQPLEHCGSPGGGSRIRTVTARRRRSTTRGLLMGQVALDEIGRGPVDHDSRSGVERHVTISRGQQARSGRARGHHRVRAAVHLQRSILIQRRGRR